MFKILLLFTILVSRANVSLGNGERPASSDWWLRSHRGFKINLQENTQTPESDEMKLLICFVSEVVILSLHVCGRFDCWCSR